MQEMMSFIRTDLFLMGLLVFVLLIMIGVIVIAIKTSRLTKRYKQFMEKLGKGKNLEEDLENYLYRVEKVEKQNAEIMGKCKSLDEQLIKCTQKIGMVRYNAFQDTGSDLSFTLAMLDQKNNGVVLNGIYSREMSNIYAKPVENGKSKYTLSDEEKQAIEKAMNTDDMIIGE